MSKLLGAKTGVIPEPTRENFIINFRKKQLFKKDISLHIIYLEGGPIPQAGKYTQDSLAH